MKIKVLFLLIAITMLVGTSFAKKPRGHDEAAAQLVAQVITVAKTKNITATTMYIEYTYLGWEKAFLVDSKGKSYGLMKDGKIINGVDSQIESFMKDCNKDKECYEGMKINGIKVYRQHG